VLKVQLEAGLPAPNIIEGFRYESTVQPPDWPVAGTFNYFRAEVLDTPGYAMGESFSVAASIVYADTVASTQNQLVIAHYRNDKLLAYHCAVSEIVGTEDYLIAQSIQEAAVGDFFYVAITPDTTDLINFNHNLASLETIPADRSFNFPADIDSPLLIAGTADNPHVAGKYIATVTKDTSTIFTLCGGGGGGGAGGTSSTEDNANSVIIGRGGTGGCAGFPFVFNIALAKGDILTWTLGAGGAGGVSGGDGMPGMPSFLRLNGGVIGGTPSTPGGVGGFSGDNDSNVGFYPDFFITSNMSVIGWGGTGGGGGARVVNGTPGPGGISQRVNTEIINIIIAFQGGFGGSNPRSGGGSAILGLVGPRNGSSSGGSTAGIENRLTGSGGGAGANPGALIGVGMNIAERAIDGFQEYFGNGGDGAAVGDPANPGSDGITGGAGGGGGGSTSAVGLSDTVIGGNGGRGGDGYIYFRL